MKLTLSKKVQLRDMKLADSGATQHPNKVPFTCSLFDVDVPSNGSPEGANGKRIMISSAVADANLDTFVGMGINIDFGEGMRDHDPRFKVGVITKTYRTLDGKAMAEGYVFGKDFPDVVATIRYYNNLASEWQDPWYQMGTSIEMEAVVTQSETDDDVLDVTEFIGTGAAVLFAASAAYSTTTFAARNQKGELDEMKPEELKAMLEGFKTDITASVEKSVGEVKTEVGAIKTEVESLKAANAQQQQQEEENAEIKAAKERAEKAEKELAELKAAQTAAEPQRKTASPANLLAKYGNTAQDAASDYKSFCAAVDQMNLPSVESMKLKLQAKQTFAAKEAN